LLNLLAGSAGHPSPGNREYEGSYESFLLPLVNVASGLIAFPRRRQEVLISFNQETVSSTRYHVTFSSDSRLLDGGRTSTTALVLTSSRYTRETLERWLADTESFHLGLLDMRTAKERHDALFDFRHPLKRSIPIQMIRHKDILVGHGVLVPGKKAKGTDHITKGCEYVKLSFFLSSDPRRMGVLFAALRLLLEIAVIYFGVTIVYVKADTSNIAATNLLYKLMDWSKLQWKRTGTTGDSTVAIEHRDPSSRDNKPRFDIGIRPAAQWAWPISHAGHLFPNNCKILDNCELKT
jgi:hypothetical protein